MSLSPARIILFCFPVIAALSLACMGSGEAPSLLMPEEGDSLAGLEINFSWSAVEGATGYRLLIDRDSSFFNPLVKEDTITACNYTLDLSGPYSPLSGEGTYYWQVAAYKQSWGPPSDIRSFYYIKASPP